MWFRKCLAVGAANIVGPIVAFWAARQEKRIMAEGSPLSEEMHKIAASLGIKRVDLIRVRVIDPIPLPCSEPWIRLALKIGLPVFRPGGMALGYGIYLLPGQDGSLPHELVHVQQYERLGGVFPFMKRYINECISHGYVEAPLELEARFLSFKI